MVYNTFTQAEGYSGSTTTKTKAYDTFDHRTQAKTRAMFASQGQA